MMAIQLIASQSWQNMTKCDRKYTNNSYFITIFGVFLEK
jgi:hypothetical protein